MHSVAIVGLGKIGVTLDEHLDPLEYVYTHARAFHQHESFELVAGIDRQPSARSNFSHRYAKPAFESIKECLAEVSPDIFVICVPTTAHLSVLQEIFRYSKPKAILCEKPLSYDVAEASKIVSLCEAAEVPLFTNYMRRAHLAVREIKWSLDSKKIVLPVKGTVWYSKGLLHNGSHFFDLLRYWLGEMQSFQVVQVDRTSVDDAEPDVRVQFEGGSVYFLAANEEHFSHYAIELISPSGRLRYDRGGECVEWQAASKSDLLEGYVKLSEDAQQIPGSLSHIQLALADELSASLNGKPANICSGYQALENIKNLTSILESLS